LPAPSPNFPVNQCLAGHLVVFTGKLGSLGRKEARALVARLGGSTAADVSGKTTMLVVGAEGFESAANDPSVDADEGAPRDKSLKLKRAEELNAQHASQITIISEDDFCRKTGVPTATELRQQYHATRDLLARYRHLREDHLRYLVKCGVVIPVHRTNTDMFFAFPDLSPIKQANDEIGRGSSFRSVVKSLLADRDGQLSFDFRLQAEPARILTLERPNSNPAAITSIPAAPPLISHDTERRTELAEQYFRTASGLDDGDDATVAEAAATYRKALELDPHLVAALINLANIHYSRDQLIEAQALYEQAIGIETDYFEAHFNLGNIHHDLGRFPEAQACYREALRLNPSYAEAHFYLAVTFEKMGLSQEARPHWSAYRRLAPQGEWVELAKEFSE
jgi:tetratricopeptide (TPR) repeat protein